MIQDVDDLDTFSLMITVSLYNEFEVFQSLQGVIWSRIKNIILYQRILKARSIAT